MSAEPAAYLKTLCSCFSPRSALVAPKKALNALFDDLQNVIEHPSIGNARYSRLLFIEISLSVSVASNEFQFGKIFNQKQVEKLICPVGQNLSIPISIKSHLPGTIELSSVKLFVVSRDEFTNILTNGDAVQEEDATKVLTLDAPVKLDPGENNYTFEWSPLTPGQHILSTVEIVWKKGYFYYDSMDLQEPLLSIEVLPSEPTHSISVEPAILIPGHIQEIQIKINAESDFLISGTLTLSGTDGVSLIPSGDDPQSNEWKKDCEIKLNECKPRETQQLRAHVRCDMIKGIFNSSNSMNSGRGLLAKMETTYLLSQSDAINGSQRSCMKANLECFTPLLEKTALSVESVETHWLDVNEKFILSILLTSNTPHYFTVKEWEVKLAPPIIIATDRNENLLKRTVSDGDQLAFAFECLTGNQSDYKPGILQETLITLKLCDEIENVFSLDLKLDLDEFYSRLSQRESLTGMFTLQATLKLDNIGGFVGQPVSMKFVVENPERWNSNSSDNFRTIGMTYVIECEESDWIVAGKINGFIEVLDSNSFIIDIISIPISIGMLRNFPRLSVRLLSSSGMSKILNVECQTPDVFQSMPPTDVTGIGIPSSAYKS